MKIKINKLIDLLIIIYNYFKRNKNNGKFF